MFIWLLFKFNLRTLFSKKQILLHITRKYSSGQNDHKRKLKHRYNNWTKTRCHFICVICHRCQVFKFHLYYILYSCSWMNFSIRLVWFIFSILAYTLPCHLCLIQLFSSVKPIGFVFWLSAITAPCKISYAHGDRYCSAISHIGDRYYRFCLNLFCTSCFSFFSIIKIVFWICKWMRL